MKITTAITSPSRHWPHLNANGISLFELLLTIGLIAIFTSLAMPLFGGHVGYAAIKAKRNAQELASECSIGQAAGVQFVVENDLQQTLQNLMEGAVVADGPFSGRRYGRLGMSPEDVVEASKHLKVSQNSLLYHPLNVE